MYKRGNYFSHASTRYKTSQKEIASLQDVTKGMVLMQNMGPNPAYEAFLPVLPCFYRVTMSCYVSLVTGYALLVVTCRSYSPSRAIRLMARAALLAGPNNEFLS